MKTLVDFGDHDIIFKVVTADSNFDHTQIKNKRRGI